MKEEAPSYIREKASLDVLSIAVKIYLLRPLAKEGNGINLEEEPFYLFMLKFGDPLLFLGEFPFLP